MAKTVAIDFSDIPSNSIEAGKYDATITDAELRISKNSNQPYINLEMEITGVAEEDEATVEELSGAVGRKVWYMLSLSKAAGWRMLEDFRTFGIDTSKPLNIEATEGTPSKVLSPMFVGAPITVQVEPEEYNGQVRAKVKKLLAYHGDGLEIAGDEEDFETEAGTEDDE